MSRPFSYPALGSPPRRERYARQAPLGELRQRLRAAEAQTHPEPSHPQRAAGNYPKGLMHYRGLEVRIENPAGSTRSGKTREGKPWSVTLPFAYGYIRRTLAKDGDQLDCFLGPHLDSDVVFGIDQVDPRTGRYDETKWMLGWKSRDAAKKAYFDSYTPNWQGFLAITAMTFEQFRRWLEHGDTHKPIGPQVTELYRRHKPAAGQMSLWREEDHPRQPDGEFAPKGQGEVLSPHEQRKQVIQQALAEHMPADQAAAIAEKMGLGQWHKASLQTLVTRHTQLQHEQAKPIAEQLGQALEAHYAAQGRQFNPDAKPQMSAEEINQANKRDEQRWKEERKKEDQDAVAFSEQHWKDPPDASRITPKQYAAIEVRRRLAEVEKDFKKIVPINQRIRELEDVDYHLRTPEQREELTKLRDKCDGRAFRALAQKYPYAYRAEQAAQRKGTKGYHAVSSWEAAEVVSTTKQEMENRLKDGELHWWTSKDDAATFNPIRQHAELVKQAVQSGEDLPEAVIEQYAYEDWMTPKLREKLEGPRIVKEWKTYGKSAQHKFLSEELDAAMKHAGPRLQGILDRAEAAYKQLDTVPMEIDVAWNKAREDHAAARKKLDEWQSKPFSEQDATPDAEKHELELADAVMEAGRAFVDAEAKRDQARRERQAQWLDSVLPNDGGQVEIEVSPQFHFDQEMTDRLEETKAFLRRALAKRHGTLRAKLEPTEVSHYGGHRAYASGGAVHIPGRAPVWTLVHELGHILEEQQGHALGELSKTFALRQIQAADQEIQHLGQCYEPHEYAARDQLVDTYAGKWYAYSASEILSMGIQNLYTDALAFYKQAPEHFKYTIAAIHGLLL